MDDLHGHGVTRATISRTPVWTKLSPNGRTNEAKLLRLSPDFASDTTIV